MFMYKFLKDIYIKRENCAERVPTYETDAIHFRFFFSTYRTCMRTKKTKSELDYDRNKENDC